MTKIHSQIVFQIRLTHHSLSDADKMLCSILDLLVWHASIPREQHGPSLTDTQVHKYFIQEWKKDLLPTSNDKEIWGGISNRNV